MEEEINSYLDSPSESVYDEFEELAYAGSVFPTILGSPESVKKLTGEIVADSSTVTILPAIWCVLQQSVARRRGWSGSCRDISPA